MPCAIIPGVNASLETPAPPADPKARRSATRRANRPKETARVMRWREKHPDLHDRRQRIYGQIYRLRQQLAKLSLTDE